MIKHTVTYCITIADTADLSDVVMFLHTVRLVGDVIDVKTTSGVYG